MKQSLLAFICLILFSSCVVEPTYENSPKGNMEVLWKIMDEHYCFFDEKNINWQAVKVRYEKQIDEKMNDQQLFEVLTNMLGELKDGHVNLSTAFDYGRYWKWFENYPSNFSDSLVNKYLGTDYRISSGMKYRILDDNTGYIYCETFENDFGAGNLNDILYYLAPCKGLIIDIRNNGGGLMTSAEELAARFTNDAILVGYMQHKTGTGHQDFSPLQEQILKPSKGMRWQKKVVVLTNRSVFSAANEFVKYMQQCPNVTVVGDRTGGGAGLPFSSELPNGWSVRFSACPMYDKNKQSTEFGIDPNHKIDLKDSDLKHGIDTIIEFSRNLL